MFRFLIKRVLVCAGIITGASIFFIGVDGVFMAGVWAGAWLALCKAFLYGALPVWLAASPQKKSRAFLWSALLTLFTLALLMAAAFYHTRLFWGLALGLPSVAVAVCVNAFTEHCGLTRNHWGENTP